MDTHRDVHIVEAVSIGRDLEAPTLIAHGIVVGHDQIRALQGTKAVPVSGAGTANRWL